MVDEKTLAAFVPENSEGLLLVKIHRDRWSQDEIDHVSRAIHHAVQNAGLTRVSVLCCPLTDDEDIELQFLSDGKVEELGFVRIDKNKDITDITRSFG